MTPATDTAREGADLREALESLVSAFDVSNDGTVSVKPDRLLSVALLNAQGALDDTHIGPLAEEIDRLTAALDTMRAERDEAEAFTQRIATRLSQRTLKTKALAEAALADLVTATAEAAALRQRVEAVLTEACRPSAILLMAGEMTAQERRTAQAVANGIAAKIRSTLSRSPADAG